MAYVTKVYVPDDLAEYTAKVVATGGTGPQGATGPAGSGIELLTTKGDLLGYSTEGARIPVGSNGQVLVARSSATPGVAWETPDVTQAELDAVAAAAQPLDSDLTAIAALTTTAYGRALLELANAAALQTAGGLVIGTNVQAYSAVLAATTASFTSADETRVDAIEELARDAVGTALVAGEGIDITVNDGSDTITVDAETASDTNAGVVELATSAETITGTDTVRAVTPAGFAAGLAKQAEVIVIAVGDETTAITTGTAKVTFRMPFAMTLTAVRASLSTASSSGVPTFDINEGGSTILSTKLTIDANELTSTTAATAAVISDTALADDAEITIDIDVAGTGAKGPKVALIGTRT